LMWGMADGIRTVYPQAIYPTLYFIEPAQVGYLKITVRDSSSSPLYHAYTTVVNSHKCGFTNLDGLQSFGWLLPGTYSVNVHKDLYLDSILTNITVVAGETTNASINLRTYPPYGEIYGLITDNMDFPVIGAIVVVNGLGITDTTDENGYYSFDSLGTGYYDFYVSHARHTDTTVIDAAVPYYDSSEVNALIMVLPPTTINVPDDIASVNDAVDLAVYGDTILIAPGIYRENIQRFNKELRLIGRGGRDSTIIEQASSGSPIVNIGGELSLALIEGITFQNSSGASAILVDGTSISIRNCRFYNNHSYYGGAITGSTNGVLDISDNIFTENHADYNSGAVGVSEMVLWAANNRFESNSAGTGGAVCVSLSANFMLYKNIFYNNSAVLRGSAVYIADCHHGGEIINNTVAFNSCSDSTGSTIKLDNVESISIINNIISQNAGDGINGLYNYPEPTATYNDVWGNSPDYVNVNPGDGSISEDPLFAGGEPYSLHLTSGSPCIDSGDPDYLQDPDTTRADMGALYFHHQITRCPYILGDINASGTPNGIDVTYGVRYFKGGPVPPVTCDNCSEAPPFYAAGDVNGSCTFNGIDISYMVNYFKGGSALHPCPDCPPIAGDRRTSVGVREEAIPENLKTQEGLLSR
jgi:hypothetical protein